MIFVERDQEIEKLPSIPEDEHGLVPETLDAVLSDRLSRGLRMPRLIYLVPTANNPTGTTLPAHRRRQIYDLACKYDFLILEDDPYMFLNFDDEHLRLTFSKIALKDMDLAARTLADIIKEEQSRSLQKQPQRLATQH
ncbi:hypothetical protein MSG28_012901 [Choristoneura fumiferana]|uniref:Uncharacterized protein n=1 Tax=Choristoneura fumiferana TaxID=7141 RepID=A0ACC0JIE0_CHOFU|nr:hypothetical protein MSG28_012901 [Choristoneura fumiferana]